MPRVAEAARTKDAAEVVSSKSSFESVAELYAWMQQSIMDGAEAQKSDPRIESEVRPNSRQSAHRRMEIYSNDFYGRFRDVIAVDFDAIQAALGDDAWFDLTCAFVFKHPSRSQNINNYGYELVDFMRDYELPHREFLIELGRLQVEIAKRHTLGLEAHLSADDFGTMTEEDWEQANLRPRSSVSSYRFDFDVLSYLNDFSNDEGPEIPSQEVESYVQIYRKGEETWRQGISRARHEALQALIAGDPLGVALAKAGEFAEGDEESFATEVQGWFADWMSDGIFAEIKRPE